MPAIMHQNQDESILNRGDLMLQSDPNTPGADLKAITATVNLGELCPTQMTTVVLVGINNHRWEHLHVFQHN